MPLLNPNQIKSVLRETKTDRKELEMLLEENCLSPSDCIAELGSTIRQSDNTAMRLRGLETALKLNGLLNNNDNGVSVPTVNIIINDPQFDVNPILIPRT